MSSANKITCITDIFNEYCDFTWVINNFTLLSAKRSLDSIDGIKSPTFTVGSDKEKKFELQLKKDYGIPPDYNEYINLYILCVNNPDLLWQCYKFKISIIKDGTIVRTYEPSPYTSYFDKVTFIGDISYNFMKFISSTDTITIRCESTLIGDQKDFLSDESVNTNKVLVPKLNFDSTFFNKDLSDVLLQAACGKEIPAHKVILAAASPVFKAMFTHDMMEKKSKSVNLIDISYEAVVEMLRYIYLGSIENHEIPLIIELLGAADKYQLDELKDECDVLLSSKISSENAIDILKAADKYNIKKLKKKAVDFVKIHLIQSSETNDVGSMILSMERLFN